MARGLPCGQPMRVAIPTWGGRVSPVFDVARRLLLVDVNGDAEVSREEVAIEASQPATRAIRTTELGVNTLICGAISTPLESLLVSAHVCVIPDACGSVEDVLRAFLAGSLEEDAFLMPGCCHRRRRIRGRRGRHANSNVQGEIL